MKMRIGFVVGIAAVLIGISVMATTLPRLVIYQDGFSLVYEVRTVDLATEGTLSMAGFPRGLLPDSVMIEGLPIRAIRFIVRDTARFPASLVGMPVEVIADGIVYRGRLIEAGDRLVLATEQKLVILSRFDLIRADLPQEFPGTELLIDYITAAPGSTNLVLRYLTHGLGWSAHYNITLEDGELHLIGLARLENRTGIDFLAADVELVAGDVDAPPAPRRMEFDGMVTVLGRPMVADEAAMVLPAFEYHRYLIPAPVDLKAGEVFIPFVTATLPYTRAYRFAGGPVEILVRFDNAALPLPAGGARVFTEGIFAGAATIGHTAIGEEVELSLGTAFDLTGTRVRLEERRVADRIEQITYRIVIRSAKDEPVEVEVLERMRGDWRIISSTIPYEIVDARTLLFNLPVPAEGEVELIYTVEHRF